MNQKIFKFSYMGLEKFYRSVNGDWRLSLLWQFVESQRLSWEDAVKLWKQIGFNYLILRKKLWKQKRRGIIKFRWDLAVYRLYRMNLPISLISKVFGIRHETIKRIVGRIFKTLCMNDDRCVFRKYFDAY